MKRVVLVDDDTVILSAYRRILSPFIDVLRVVSFDDAEAALQHALRDPPDLLWTDCNHPGPNGIAMLHTLRDNAATKALPVWMISGAAGPQQIEEAQTLGADTSLRKPFAVQALWRKLDDELGLSLLRSEDGEVRTITWKISVGIETPDTDFKERLPLESKAEVAALAKDVIAMANFGGGHVIVGMKEANGVFVKTGVDAHQMEVLEVTKLNGKLRAYIDPEHHVAVRRVEIDGVVLVALTVAPATETILLARRDNPDAALYQGRLYSRTVAAESAEVRTHSEARRLFDRIVDARVGRSA